MTHKRTKYKKEFLNPDGSITAIISQSALHYLDSNGDYKDIETTFNLSNSEENTFENLKNSFKTKFKPITDKNSEFLSLKHETNQISFSFKAEEKIKPIYSHPYILYPNPLKGTTFFYHLEGENLKETIILNKTFKETLKENFYLSFKLNLKDLKPVINQNNSISFIDTKTNKEIFFIPELFMYDSKGKTSYDIKIDLKQESDLTFSFNITPDINFLKDETTNYPVFIDPTISLTANSLSFIASKQPLSNYNNTLKSGYDSYYGTSKGFFKFDLSSLPIKADVVSTKLTLSTITYMGEGPTQYPDDPSYSFTTNIPLNFYKVTSNWASNTITYNNQPTFNSTPVLSSPITWISTSQIINRQEEEPRIIYETSGTLSGDISPALRDWLLFPNQNYGISIAFQSNPSYVYQFNAPTLSITYYQRLGFENYWGYIGLKDSKRFKSTVNTTNGNLTLTINELTLSSRGLKNPISRTYNSLSLKNSPYGYGWCFSFSINIFYDAAESNTLTLQDEDGTYHKFYEDKQINQNPVILGTTTYTSPGIYDTIIKNDDNTFTLKRPEQITFNFNSSGKLTSIKDRYLNTYTYSYDAGKKLTSITDPSGRITNLSYNTYGRLILIKDYAQREWKYTYNSNNDLSSSTDPLNYTTYYFYDSYHNLTSLTDPGGATIYFTYGGVSGRLISFKDSLNNISNFNYDYISNKTEAKDPLNYPTQFTFNQYGNPTSIKDPLNNTTTILWDSENKFTKIIEPNGAYTDVVWSSCPDTQDKTRCANIQEVKDPQGNITKYTYDSYNNVTSIEDPKLNKTEFTYSFDGKILLSKKDPLGYITSYGYNSYGQPQAEQDPLGRTTTYTYDNNGNPTSKKDALNNTTTMQYNNKDQLISTTDPLGNTTTYTYDLLGNLLQVIDPEGKVTTYTYDQNFNRTQVKDHLNDITTFVYDSEDRLIKEIAPKGEITQYIYDSIGNNIKIITPKGEEKIFSYDGSRRLIEVKDFDLSITKYFYDSNSNLIEVKDPNNISKTFTYDILNRPVEVKENGITQGIFTYDQNSNKISYKDAKGQTTYYTYNALNKLIKITYPDNSTITFTYDAAGNQIQAQSSNAGSNSFSYDSLNRITQSTDPFSYIVNFSYDQNSRLTSKTNDLGTSYFSYDTKNRLIQSKNPQNRTTHYSYDDINRRIAMLYPNSLSTQYTYDQNSQVTNIKLKNIQTNTELYNLSYSFDQNGNITDSTELNLTRSYTYDSKQQLINYRDSNNLNISYTYDTRGNIISKTENNQTTSYSYDSNNRLLSITYPNQTQETYTYDLNGNPTTKTTTEGTTYYTYDSEDRLIQITKPDNTIIKYTYDSYGKLIKKEKNNQITTYHYDTGLSKEVTPTHTIYYEHNSNGELISLTLNNQAYFYHFNSHGDTIALSDTNQNIIATYQYDPYGNLINEYNPQNIPNPYLYVGAYSVRYDKDIDLYHMSSRYYNPKTGRFITKDKYPSKLAEPITHNP